MDDSRGVTGIKRASHLGRNSGMTPRMMIGGRDTMGFALYLLERSGEAEAV